MSSQPVFLHQIKEMLLKAFDRLEEDTRTNAKPEDRYVFGKTKIVPFFQKLAQETNTSKDSITTLWYESNDSDPSRPETKKYRVATRLDPISLYAYGKPYLEVFGEVADERQNSTPSTFYSFLRDRLGQRQLTSSPLRKEGFDPEEWKRWIVAAPELLLEIVGEPEMDINYHPVTFSRQLLAASDQPATDRFLGALLRHGPTVGTDSIFLYADIGRFLRTTEILGLGDKRMVYFSDREGFRNHDPNGKVEDAMSNLQFRMSLYTKMGLIEPGTHYSSMLIGEYEVDERARRYAQLAGKLNGDPEIDPYSPLEVLANELKTRMAKRLGELYLSPDTARELDKQAEFIARIAAHYKNLDEVAFRKYLIQCASLRTYWPSHLHLGTSHDEELDTIDESQVPHYRAYMRRYWIPGSKKLQQWDSVHDTRASLQTKSSGGKTSQHGQETKSQLDAALAPILISCTDSKQIHTWLSRFDDLSIESDKPFPRYQLARILGDILSFVHFLPNEDGGAAVTAILSQLGEEFLASWSHYATPEFLPKAIDFSENWHTLWGSAYPLPYYFHPYSFAMQSANHETWRSQLAVYAELIAYINREATYTLHPAFSNRIFTGKP